MGDAIRARLLAPEGDDLAGMPPLDGVSHHMVGTRSGARAHVATAGPESGRAVMLVHGFPQHWWEWRQVIPALADAGYRVLAPDLRGAGWSDTHGGQYRKLDMAGDLLDVLDAFGVHRAGLVAHDWGGPVAFLLALMHPERVTGFVGLNTIAPWLTIDWELVAHAWTFYYQYPMLAPVIGPRLLADPQGRYLRWLARWVGAGWTWDPADAEIFLARMRDPARARAGSLWYRTFQAREALAWLRGAFGRPLTHPMQWITGLRDPVITPVFHRGYEQHAPNTTFEHVPDVGHWIVEQAPDIVADRLIAFFNQHSPTGEP